MFSIQGDTEKEGSTSLSLSNLNKGFNEKWMINLNHRLDVTNTYDHSWAEQLLLPSPFPHTLHSAPNLLTVVLLDIVFLEKLSPCGWDREPIHPIPPKQL